MSNPKLDAILSELSNALLERYGVRFNALWLYGPQARGDAGHEADFDLLLVLTDPERPDREIDRITDILLL